MSSRVLLPDDMGMDNTKGQDMDRETLHDAIRPANFNPADVEVVGWMDTRPPVFNADGLFGLPTEMYDAAVAEFAAYRAAWIARNVELFGREYPGSKCEHCGAAIRWAAIVRYIPTGQHFITGETCADERMSLTNRREHDLRMLRMSIQHRAEQQRLLEAKAAFYRDHAAEAAYLFNDDRAYDQFIDDLKSKLIRYGSLSDKQVACITRNIQRDADRAAARAVTPDQPALVVPDGRVAIEGKVISTKLVETGFGTQYKMLVELADGNRIFGTVPKGIDPAKGDTVGFTARIEASRDDDHFGFFSRPTNPTIITEA